ncbi:hypothetical protein KPH14_000833, partial [Odynerus spinipes]
MMEEKRKIAEEWKTMGEKKRGDEGREKKNMENGLKSADGAESDGKEKCKEPTSESEVMTMSAGEEGDCVDSGGVNDDVIVVDECTGVREGVRAAKRARIPEDAETDDSASSATISSGETSPCLVRRKSRPKSAKKCITEPPKELSVPREEERCDSRGDAAGRMNELGELEVSVSTLTDLVLKRMERISEYALANRNFAAGQKRELKAVMTQIRAIDAGVRKCAAIRQELDRELLREFQYVRELRESELRGGRDSLVPEASAPAAGKRAVGPISFAAAVRNSAGAPTANPAYGFGTRPQTTVAGGEVFYFGRPQGTGGNGPRVGVETHPTVSGSMVSGPTMSQAACSTEEAPWRVIETKSAMRRRKLKERAARAALMPTLAPVAVKTRGAPPPAAKQVSRQ